MKIIRGEKVVVAISWLANVKRKENRKLSSPRTIHVTTMSGDKETLRLLSFFYTHDHYILLFCLREQEWLLSA